MKKKKNEENPQEYIQLLEQKIKELTSKNELLEKENFSYKNLKIKYDETQQQLEIVETRYQSFFENTGTAMAVFGSDSLINSCNTRFVELCECGKDEIEGILHWYDFVHEQDKERMMGYHQQRQKNDKNAPAQYHFRFITKKGNTREIFLNIVVLQETGERLASLTDVTELVQLQKELKKQLHFTETLINTVPVPVFYKDIQGKYLGCNKAFEEMMGVSTSEIIGKTVYDLTLADIAYLYAQKDNELFLNPGFQHYEWILRNKKGEIREVVYNKASFFDAEDQNAGLIGTVLDVTERNKNMEQLKQSEERFRLFYEQSPIAYQSLDFEGCILDINEVWLQTLGYQREEVIGKWFGDFLHVRYKTLFKERFEQFKKAGEVNSVDFELLKKDGTYVFVLFSGKISYDVNGEMVRTHCVFYDFSERHKAELLLQESEQQLQTLFDATPSVMCLLNEKLEIIKINKTGLQFAESNLEEILYKQGGDAFGCIYALKNPEGCGKGDECKHCTVRNTVLQALHEHKNISRAEASMWVKGQDGQHQQYYFLQSVNILNFSDWKGILVTLDNITDRKLMEMALQQSEQRYQKITEAITDYIYTVKIENNIAVATTHSITCYGVTGYSKQEFENNTLLWYQIIFDDDKVLVEKQLQQLFAFKTAVSIEHRIYKKNGEIRWIANTVIPNIDKNGFLISYDGIIRDITERKIAELQVLEAHQYVESIFKAAPIAIGVVKNRIFDKVNQYMITLLGYTEEELCGKSASMVYPTEEEYQWVGEQKYRQITEKGTGTMETRWKCKDGTIIDIILSSTPIDVDDWSKGVTFTAIDITERKRAEHALRKSEEKYRNIIETMNEGLLMVDNEDVILFANNRLCQIFGFSPNELIGKKGLETIIYHEDRAIIYEKNQMRTHHVSDTYQIRGVTKSGNLIWLSISGSPVADDFGNVVGSVGLITDITESKQAEAALQKSEQRYRTIVDTANEGIWTMDENFITSYVNTKMAAMLGYDVSEMLGRPITDFMIKAELQENTKKMQNRAKGINEIYERSFIRKDGNICNFIVSANSLRDEDGTFRGSFAMLIDISDLRRIEKELLEKNQQMEAFFNYSLDMLCIANTEGYFIRLNPEWENTLGYALTELEGQKFFDFIHPDDIQPTLDALKDLENQKLVLSFINRYRCKDVTYRWIEWRSKQIGNIIYSAARDITEQRELQIALMESEKLNRDLIEQMTDGVYQSTPEGKFLMVNQAMVNMFGYSSIEEMLATDIPNELYPTPAARTGIYPESGYDELKIYQLKKKDGSLIWVEENGWYIKDENGKIIRHEGVMRDVTQRVKMEEALRNSEENLATTLQSIGDGVIATDKSGYIVNMNHVAEMLCGWTLQEAKGKLLNEVFYIVNAKTLDKVDNPVNKVIETGKIVGLANHTMLISKNGQQYQIADSASPIRNRNGEITGVVLVFSDVTEEYALAEKLRISEERLDLAMAVKNEGVWDWNLITNEAFFDERYYTMAGYEPNEFPQNFDTWAAHVHPEDLENAKKEIEDYLSGKISNFDIEFRFKHKNNSWIWIQGRGKIVAWDENKKPARIIGTHTDITLQKLSQIALQESEEVFRKLYEDSYEPILLMKDNTFVNCNNATVQMLGAENKEQILGATPMEISPEYQPDGRTSIEAAHYFINSALQNGYERFEWLCKKFNDAPIYFEITLMPIILRGENLLHITWRDITERKAAELKLRNSEERFRSLVNSLSDVIYTLDLEQRHTGVFGGWVEKAGLTPEFFLGKSAVEIYGQEMAAIHEQANLRALNGEVVTYEWDIANEQGTHYYQTIVAPMYDADGNIYGIVGAGRNITDRVNAESELKLKSFMLDQISDMVTITDLQGIITYVNQAELNISGLRKEDIIGKSVAMYGEDASRGATQKEIIENTLKNGAWRGEVVNYFPDGKECILDCRTTVIVDEKNNPLALCGITTDITRNKQAELEIIKAKEIAEESEKQLKAAQKTAKVGNWIWYIQENKLWWSDEMYNIFEIEKERFSGELNKVIESAIHPDDRQAVAHSNNSVVQHNKPIPVEYRIITKDGSIKYVSALADELILDDNGKSKILTGIVKDITDYKLIQIELQEAKELAEEREQKFKNLFQFSNIANEVYDTDGKLLDVNNACCKLFGIESAEVVKGFCLFEDPNIPVLELERLKCGESVKYETYFDFDLVKQLNLYSTSKFGKIFVHVHIDPMLMDGKVYEYLVQIIDLTEIKEAEGKIIESEAKFRSYFENSLDGIFVVDENGNYLDVNPAATRITEYSKEELLQMNIVDFLPENEKEKGLAHFNEIKNIGIAKGQFSFIRKDKSIGCWHVEAVKLSEIKVLSFTKEITEIKKAENIVKQNQDRLKILLDLSQMSSMSIDEIYNFALDKSIELCNSEIGFLGFLNEDETWVRIHAWSTTAMQMCAIDDKFIDFEVAKTGIWGEVIRQRKTIIIQNYNDDNPLKRGTPNGHVKIKNYLSIPVFENGKIAAIVAIGNKNEDYNENDVQELSLLLEGVWNIVRQRNYEKEILQAKEKAELSELKIRNMFNNSLTGFIYFDTNGNILDANKAVLDIFGSPSLEASQQHVNLLTLKNLVDVGFADDVRKSIEKKQSVTNSTLYISRWNKQSYIQYQIIPIVINEEIVGLWANFNDLTQIYQLQDTLKMEKDRLQGILEGTNAGTWEWNILTGETIFNERWAEIIGYTLNEISPLSIDTWAKYCHPDDLKLSNALIEKHLKGESDYYSCEVRMAHKNGSWIWVLDHGKVVTYTTDGKPLLMMGTHLDITERKQAEDKLNTEREQLLSIFNSIEAVIYITDPITHEIIYVNKFFQNQLSSDYMNKKCYKAFQGLDAPCPFCTNDIILKQKPEPYNWKFYNKNLDRHYEIVDRIIRWTDGRDVRFEMAIDITEREQAENKLRESEEKHRRLFETMSTGVVYQDTEGKIIAANPAAEKILHITIDQMKGKTSMDPRWKMVLDDGSFVPASEHPAMVALRTGEKIGPLVRGIYIPEKDDYAWILINAIPLFNDGEDKPFQVYATFDDITERKQIEIKLKESELQYRNIANAGLALIWKSGPDKMVNYFNDPWYEFTGRTAEQELGYGWTEGVHPDDLSHCVETYLSAFDKREPFEMEYRLLHISGQYRFILDMGTPNFNSKGEFIGYLGHCFDITDRKLAEVELLKAKEKAEENEEQIKIQNQEILFNYERLESLLKVSQFQTNSIQELLDFALSQAVALTKSKIGYIYFYEEDKKQFILNTWSKEVMKECTVINPQTIYELEKTGCWGEAVRQRKPIVINDYQAKNPLKKGIPEGHVKLEKFLTIPVIVDNKIVAVAGVANKITDYDEADIRQLILLMDNVWKISERVTLMKNLQLAKEKAEESEEKFRSIAEQLNDMIALTDDLGIITYASPASVAIFGLAPEEMAGKKFTNFLDESSIPKALEAFRNDIANNGSTLGLELVMKKQDGTLFFGELNGASFKAGSIHGALVTIRDISERKRAEMELIQSEARFRSTFNQSPVGSVIVGLDKHFTQCNSAFCNFIGYSEDELVGKTIMDITYPEDMEIGMQELKQMVDGKLEFYSGQKRYLHKNGAVLWGDITIRLIRDTDKKPLYFLPIIQDITERKRAEEALRESEERFKSLHNASFGGIAIHDKGIILECNQGLAEMTGYTVEELTSGMDGLLLIAEKSREDVMSKIMSGYEKPYEAVGLRKNGTEYPLRLEARNVRYKGKMVRTVEFRDITEIKQAEQKALERQLFIERIAEQSPDFIYVFDIHAKSNIFINKDLRAYLGYQPNEAPDDSYQLIEAVIHPDDVAQFKDYGALIDKWDFEYVKSFEYRLKDAAGNWRYFIGKEKEFQRKEGKIISLIGVVSDVTEQKKSELEIKISEQKYRMLFENMLNGFVLLSLIYDKNKACDLIVTEANKAFENMTGIPADSIIGKKVSGFKYFIQDNVDPKMYYDIAQYGGNFKVNRHVESWDKSFEIYAFSPEQDKLALLITDITDREKYISEILTLNEEMGSLNEEFHSQNEELQQTNIQLDEQQGRLQQLFEEIRLSEEQYRNLFDNMLNGFALHEIILNRKGKAIDYRFLQLNQAFEKITGLKSEDILYKTVKEVLPQIEDYWIDTYGKVAITGKPVRYENYSNELNRYYEVVAYCPKKLQFAVVISDITDRKNLELLEENRKVEIQQLAILAEQLIKVQDLDDFYNLLGKTLQNQIGKGYIAITQYQPDEDNMCIKKIYGIGKKLEVLSKIIGLNPIGFTIPLSDSVRYLLHNYHSRFYKYEDGIKELFHGVLPESLASPVAKAFDVKDVYGISMLQKNFILGSITIFTTSETGPLKMELLESLVLQASNAMQRIMYAEGIKEKEQQFRSIFNNSADAIFILDAAGFIMEANNIACSRLEYSKHELLGMNREQINHQDYKDAFDNALKVMKKQSMAYYETLHQSKSGKIIPVEVFVNYIDYKGKKCYMLVARDITERKEIEKRVFNAVIEAEEKERLRFSKDLHDGIGALLSSIKIYINLMESGADEQKRQMLIESTKELIGDAIIAAREISRNIQPSTIRDFGLVSSVQTFIEKINKTGILKISSRFIHLEARLPINAEVMLYRIITELINNTLKHAGAKDASLLISKNDNLIKMLYTDNGIGIAPEGVRQGLGLDNIRARVLSIEGIFRMETDLGKGVKVNIIIDLRKFNVT